MDLVLNNLQRLICHKTQTTSLIGSLSMGLIELNAYLCQTESFELELFD